MQSTIRFWARCAPCLSFLIASVDTLGQTEPNATITEPNATIEEVVVRSHPLSAEGLSQPVSVLSGDALSKSLATSLGDTLSVISGVHSASFGQAVGRPVIRGLSGPRVKIMEDRIDSLDVSVSSPDHLTTIEPFVAKDIEVIKGPSTLLYGSGAVGGVVDIHTGRIPHQVPEAMSVDLEVRGTDNADQRTAATRIEGGTGSVAFHIDGFYRDADEYEIPGFAESALQRASEEPEDYHDEHDEGEHHDEEHGEHEEHEDEEEAFGVLPGSQVQAQGGSLGLSYVADRGFLGFAVSTYDAEYGLPGHSHDHHHDEEPEGEHHEEGRDEDEHHDEEHEAHGDEEELPPVLDLKQTRLDVEAGLEAPLAGIRSLNARLGYNDYEHIEVEGEEGGTKFATKAWEARLEAFHDAFLGFEGAGGLQVSDREFSALGEEAFIPPVDTRSLGLFWVGQTKLGALSLETGARYETVKHDPSSGRSRQFDLGSASLGMISPLSERWTLSVALDYSNRAPIAEELYSDGPHLATQTFEIGDDALTKETASNISANLGYDDGRLKLKLSTYVTRFSDFIYEANTGLEEEELPVLQWSQGDATLSGFEADAAWEVMAWNESTLTISAGFDRVRARLDDGSDRNLPRIPPQRWRLVGNYSNQSFQAEVAWRSTSAQSDVAVNEFRTDGFDDLRVYLSYALDYGPTEVELFLSGRNLTDDEQRLHTSFIGNLAPRPGRTIEVGFRLSM